MLSSISSTPSHFFMSCRYFFWIGTPSSGQPGGQVVMGEGDQGELVAVEAADVDTAVAAGLHVQAGDGVGGVVVADAEDHAVQHVLQKVPDQVTGVSAGNSEKFWNHSAPLTGSL